MPSHHLVLGATGTVGSALARRLVKAGDRVLLAGRDDSRLAELAGELDQPTATFDALDTSSIDDLVADAAKTLGRLDGVAHCVGSILLKPAHIVKDDEWRETIDVNLTSAFAVVRAATKAMRSEGGSIVLVSTAAARTGIPNHEAIAAAKAGVEGLAVSAASTYADRGIRVNVVAPGLVKSRMSESIWQNEASASASESMHALGRLGEGDDVASAIAWLLDPANSWTTGQVLGVDGGLATLRPKPRRSAK